MEINRRAGTIFIKILLCIAALTPFAVKTYSQDSGQWTLSDEKFQVALKRIPTSKDMEGYVNLIHEIDQGKKSVRNESQRAEIVAEYSYLLGHFSGILFRKYESKDAVLKHSDPALGVYVDLVIDFHTACQKQGIHFKNLTSLLEQKINYLLVDALKKTFRYNNILASNAADTQASLIALVSGDLLRFITHFNLISIVQHPEMKDVLVPGIRKLYIATKDEVARGYIRDFAIFHVNTFGYGNPNTFKNDDPIILDAIEQYSKVMRAGPSACEFLGFNILPPWFRNLIKAKLSS